MKNIITCCLLLCAVTAWTQERQHPSSASISISSVPVQRVSGTDTSFQNGWSFSPILDLRTRKGWGLSYSPSIVCSPVSTGIYMHTLSAGYEKYGGKNMDLAFSYNRFFFTRHTSVPYSPLNNELSLFANYTHTWLRPILAASYGFGKDTSAGASASAHDLDLAVGVNHAFDWDDQGIFSEIELTPSLLLHAGTDTYFSFLSANRSLGHSHRFVNYIKKGKGKKSQGNNAATTVSSKFAPSSVEAMAEADLNAGRFTIRPSGSVVLPLTGTDRTPYTYGAVTLQWHF